MPLFVGYNKMENVRLKELVKSSGLSQRAFAKWLGVSRTTIEAWLTPSEHRFRKTPATMIELIELKLQKEGIIKNEKC